MNDAPHAALLPTGLYDLLPPEAELEAEVTQRLMAVLTSHGYQRVKPPLVEFEDTLLSGAGAAMANETFRTMDPTSHRMVGVRADMTPQVARIAATRLAHYPRPLRLSYAGQVLRVKGTEVRPERQIGQAGAELIGAGGPGADVEVIAVAAEALAFAEAMQLDATATWEVLRAGAAASFMLDDRGDRMVHGTDQVNSALDIFVKDMGLVLDAARGNSYPAPLASAAEQLYLAGRRAGLGRRDDSSVIEVLRGPGPGCG